MVIDGRKWSEAVQKCSSVVTHGALDMLVVEDNRWVFGLCISRIDHSWYVGELNRTTFLPFLNTKVACTSTCCAHGVGQFSLTMLMVAWLSTYSTIGLSYCNYHGH